MNDFEFSFNGLIFGGNTQYGVLSIDGLDPPDTKEDVRPKVGVDGSFVHATNYSERHVVISGEIVPTTGDPANLEALVDTWRTTFSNQTADLSLLFKLPGTAVRRVNCRPIRRKYSVDALYQLGYAQWSVELVAGDPAIYNEAGTTKLFDG